jgi:hypothetical protein
MTTVNLLTPAGVVDYPAYRSEDAEFDDGGNVSEITFTVYDGASPLFVTGVSFDLNGETITHPIHVLLTVGARITFPPRSLTAAGATPAVSRGAQYFAAVRARQMLVELMGTEDAAYALQSMPEPKANFSVAWVMSHSTAPSEINHGFDAFGRWYDFNAWADITIIRASATANQYLQDLKTILETRRGYYWQFERGFDLVRSQAVSNNSPLINNLGFQQQAEIAMTFSFVYRHYEPEGWIADSQVDDDMAHVNLIREGE